MHFHPLGNPNSTEEGKTGCLVGVKVGYNNNGKNYINL